MKVFFTRESRVFHRSLECCSLKRHDRWQTVQTADGKVAAKITINRKPCNHCHR